MERSIDREKVIKALEVCSSISDGEECPKECPYRGQDMYCIGSAGLMLDAIDLLKEQEPKTGHWIFESRYYDAWSNICSECGRLLTSAVGTYANFCSNCGAKMTGGDLSSSEIQNS